MCVPEIKPNFRYWKKHFITTEHIWFFSSLHRKKKRSRQHKIFLWHVLSDRLLDRACHKQRKTQAEKRKEIEVDSFSLFLSVALFADFSRQAVKKFRDDKEEASSSCFLHVFDACMHADQFWGSAVNKLGSKRPRRQKWQSGKKKKLKLSARK